MHLIIPNLPKDLLRQCCLSTSPACGRPLALADIARAAGWGIVNNGFTWYLLHGLMPEVLAEPLHAKEVLAEYLEGRLLRGFFEAYAPGRPGVVRKLVVLLARQSGGILDLEGLARSLGIARNTVDAYVEMLSDWGVVRLVPAYRSRLPQEMRKAKKVFFFDNGVRNAVLGNFEPLCRRADTAALWENFFANEMAKIHAARGDGWTQYFWRTTGLWPRSVDLLEERNGELAAYQLRLQDDERRLTHGVLFTRTYPESRLWVVTPLDAWLIWREADAQGCASAPASTTQEG